MLDYPVQLSAKFMMLAGVAASGDAAPTRQARQVFDTDVDALNKLIREASLPAIARVEEERL